jgi:hypothetical protein
MASSPTTVEIAHSLGKAEAKRRIASRIGELHKHIPGGMADVTSSWPSPDRLELRVVAMGQAVDATLDIEERLVRVRLMLPLFLSMMAGPIAALVRSRGEELLLSDHRRE